MSTLFASAEEILKYPPAQAGIALGQSEEDRTVYGEKIGSGPIRISLIAGCHADEPLGPRFLSHLLSYLRDSQETLGKEYTWWLVPNANPDGAAANSKWNQATEFDLTKYLLHSQRDLPGKDLEFNFPRSTNDSKPRPESQAIYRWWTSDTTPFSLHASLHGMSFAFGPWFLIDKHWVDRSAVLQSICLKESQQLGYSMHDGQRHGEKGFTRIAKGFACTPSEEAMRAYFIGIGDKETASRFQPNSMDCIQSFNNDVANSNEKALCLVSEMPLFLLPMPTEKEPEAMQRSFNSWRRKVSEAKHSLRSPNSLELAGLENITTMPTAHHMSLQWAMIRAGLLSLS